MISPRKAVYVFEPANYQPLSTIAYIYRLEMWAASQGICLFTVLLTNQMTLYRKKELPTKANGRRNLTFCNEQWKKVSMSSSKNI